MGGVGDPIGTDLSAVTYHDAVRSVLKSVGVLLVDGPSGWHPPSNGH